MSVPAEASPMDDGGQFVFSRNDQTAADRPRYVSPSVLTAAIVNEKIEALLKQWPGALALRFWFVNVDCVSFLPAVLAENMARTYDRKASRRAQQENQKDLSLSIHSFVRVAELISTIHAYRPLSDNILKTIDEQPLDNPNNPLLRLLTPKVWHPDGHPEQAYSPLTSIRLPSNHHHQQTNRAPHDLFVGEKNYYTLPVGINEDNQVLLGFFRFPCPKLCYAIRGQYVTNARLLRMPLVKIPAVCLEPNRNPLWPEYAKHHGLDPTNREEELLFDQRFGDMKDESKPMLEATLAYAQKNKRLWQEFEAKKAELESMAEESHDPAEMDRVRLKIGEMFTELSHRLILRFEEDIWIPNSRLAGAGARAAIEFMNDYLRENNGVLFRESGHAFRNLSPIASWFASQLSALTSLYGSVGSQPMIMTILMAMANASDPDRRNKLHVWLLSCMGGTSKSFSLMLAKSLATPGLVTSLVEKSAKVKNRHGNSDGTVELQEEANPIDHEFVKFGKPQITPESARYKAGLTSGMHEVSILNSNQETGDRQSINYKLACNVVHVLASNNARSDFTQPHQDRFHWILARPAQSSSKNLIDAVCTRTNKTFDLAKENNTKHWHLLFAILTKINTMLFFNVFLGDIETPFTDQKLPEILRGAEKKGLHNTMKSVRPVQRVRAGVRALTLINAVLRTFMSARSPFRGQKNDNGKYTGIPYSPIHMAAVVPLLTDAIDPNILVIITTLLKNQWENPSMSDVVNELSKLVIKSSTNEEEQEAKEMEDLQNQVDPFGSSAQHGGGGSFTSLPFHAEASEHSFLRSIDALSMAEPTSSSSSSSMNDNLEDIVEMFDNSRTDVAFEDFPDFPNRDEDPNAFWSMVEDFRRERDMTTQLAKDREESKRKVLQQRLMISDPNGTYNGNFVRTNQLFTLKEQNCRRKLVSILAGKLPLPPNEIKECLHQLENTYVPMTLTAPGSSKTLTKSLPCLRLNFEGRVLIYMESLFQPKNIILNEIRRVLEDPVIVPQQMLAGEDIEEDTSLFRTMTLIPTLPASRQTSSFKSFAHMTNPALEEERIGIDIRALSGTMHLLRSNRAEQSAFRSQIDEYRLSLDSFKAMAASHQQANDGKAIEEDEVDMDMEEEAKPLHRKMMVKFLLAAGIHPLMARCVDISDGKTFGTSLCRMFDSDLQHWLRMFKEKLSVYASGPQTESIIHYCQELLAESPMQPLRVLEYPNKEQRSPVLSIAEIFEHVGLTKEYHAALFQQLMSFQTNVPQSMSVETMARKLKRIRSQRDQSKIYDAFDQPWSGDDG